MRWILQYFFSLAGWISFYVFYVFYEFYAWWIHFPQLGALTEGTSLPTSRKRD